MINYRIYLTVQAMISGEMVLETVLKVFETAFFKLALAKYRKDMYITPLSPFVCLIVQISEGFYQDL